MESWKKICPRVISVLSIPAALLYCKWAAQETSSLPGLPAPHSENLWAILLHNLDVVVIALLGFTPVFYLTKYYVMPKRLLSSSLRIITFGVSLAAYTAFIAFLSGWLFPLYYFFGVPYAIKVLVPLVILSAVSGIYSAGYKRAL